MNSRRTRHVMLAVAGAFAATLALVIPPMHGRWVEAQQALVIVTHGEAVNAGISPSLAALGSAPLSAPAEGRGVRHIPRWLRRHGGPLAPRSDAPDPVLQDALGPTTSPS